MQKQGQLQPRNGAIASVAKTKGSPCQQNDYSHGAKRMRYSGPNLPEDIWGHIHSLMALRDAAHVASVSHMFLRSWRCRPNLHFSNKTLGLAPHMDFTKKVDHILKNHSRVGIKTFGIEFLDCQIAQDLHFSNKWLQFALKAGIEELILNVTAYHEISYNFPCSFLSDGSGNTIRYLELNNCEFHPKVGFGCLRSLRLFMVRITGEELKCLLSNTLALEQMALECCKEIVCLKIPSMPHLSYLELFECRTLKAVESKAPNLSSFHFDGVEVSLSFGDSLHLKKMEISSTIHYACAKLPSVAPNLEALSLTLYHETINPPIVPIKFLHLKYLRICLWLAVDRWSFPPRYDYFSLVNLLDACPALETLNMDVMQSCMNHDSIIGDSSDLRQMPAYRHASLKNVKIIGFCSAKSMVELVYHILENATSLECLVLDTIRDPYNNIDRTSPHEIGKCDSIDRHMIMEAHIALEAIETHIVGKISSTVKLNVLEPCSWCHALVD